MAVQSISNAPNLLFLEHSPYILPPLINLPLLPQLGILYPFFELRLCITYCFSVLGIYHTIFHIMCLIILPPKAKILKGRGYETVTHISFSLPKEPITVVYTWQWFNKYVRRSRKAISRACSANYLHECYNSFI